jgi:hypothetical protein
MDSHENFRKVYKSRNLPRSGLLEPIRIETTWKVVSIRCSGSPERQWLRISIRVMVFGID